jgi:opacity protein-like surface antigen
MIIDIKNTGLFLILFAISSGYISTSYAQSLSATSNREGAFEFYFQPHYIDSKSLDGPGGSTVELNDTWGWGFGFGYNYTEHWALNFDINWSSISYDAQTSSATGRYSGTLDTSSTLFSGVYHFSDKRFTPFVTGSLGWVFIDTNIPEGPPGSTCWWDPWWGYICSTYVPTKTETNFTYGAGIGLRFEATRDLFFRAAYTKNWIDFDKADAEDFDVLRFTVGFSYN